MRSGSPGIAKIVTSPAARHLPHPATSVPPPAIAFDFRAVVRFDAKTIKVAVGDAPKPLELTRVAGGSWSGSFGSGTVVVRHLPSSTRACSAVHVFADGLMCKR